MEVGGIYPQTTRKQTAATIFLDFNRFTFPDLDDEAEGEESLGEDDIVIHAEEDEIIEEGPVDCLPESCYKKFPIFAGDEDSPFWQGWGNLRLKTFRLIENKYFETAVITMILLSSLALVRSHVTLGSFGQEAQKIRVHNGGSPPLQKFRTSRK